MEAAGHFFWFYVYLPCSHCQQEWGRSRYTLKISIRPQPFSTLLSDLFWENGAHKADLCAALPLRMRRANGCGQIFHNWIKNCLAAFQSHLFISLAWSSRILTIFSLNAFNSHWCQSWGSLVSTRCVVERSWGHLAASGAMVTTWAGPHTCRHWANIYQERNWTSDLQTYNIFVVLISLRHF